MKTPRREHVSQETLGDYGGSTPYPMTEEHVYLYNLFLNPSFGDSMGFPSMCGRGPEWDPAPRALSVGQRISELLLPAEASAVDHSESTNGGQLPMRLIGRRE